VDVGIDAIRVNVKRLRKLSAVKICRYVTDYEAGAQFPAITVVDCGDFYTIRDGRHRFQAQLACGYQTVSVLVVNR
jgi:hypothetical protein